MQMRRPGVDPELEEPLAQLKAMMPPLTVEALPVLRALPGPSIDSVLEGREIEREEFTAPGLDGAPDVALSIFRPSAAPAAASPCVYWIHGGGMVLGDRYAMIEPPLEWVELLAVTVVSVEYRLAPEHGGTDLVDDCYAGLTWVAKHAGDLGIDPCRIVVSGGSAGGGLAAGVTLMARDRQDPEILGQLLVCPMLDHRNVTASSAQYDGDYGFWTRTMNELGWRAVLGDTPGEQVPAYVSPALASDLSGLPPTYIDAGSAEVFRDEDVAYATGIWAAGGQAELHIWAGGFHGFDLLAPAARVSAAARAARNDWLTRLLTSPR